MKNRAYATVVALTLFWGGLSSLSYGKSKRPIEDQEKIFKCRATREYVTAYRYLKSEKDFAIKEADARRVAEKVSKGCSGAAKSFVAAMRLMVQAGVPTRTAIEMAQNVSGQSKYAVKAFITIFRKAFMGSYLDLDISSSLNLAKSMAIDFKGSKKKVLKDWERIIEYCLEEEELNLSRARCAEMAMRVSIRGEEHKKSVSKAFIRAVRFIRSRSGPNLPTYVALQIAEEIVGYSPWAYKNFERAFRFAHDKGGLGLDQKASVQFAKKMAANTVRPNPRYRPRSTAK